MVLYLSFAEVLDLAWQLEGFQSRIYKSFMQKSFFPHLMKVQQRTKYLVVVHVVNVAVVNSFT